MMSVPAFAEDYITVWEDGGRGAHCLSLDRADSGNWTSGICGVGVCCGSQHGVTAQALAGYRGCSASAITEQVMSDLSLSEAAAIAIKGYYGAPGLDQLAWDPVVASVMDFGWNAGPHEAVKMLQRLIGVAPDGAIGPATVAAYRQWIATHGLAAAATSWAAHRHSFYQGLVAARPADAKFLNGWMRRSDYYLPGTPWWTRFTGAV